MHLPVSGSQFHFEAWELQGELGVVLQAEIQVKSQVAEKEAECSSKEALNAHLRVDSSLAHVGFLAGQRYLRRTYLKY